MDFSEEIKRMIELFWEKVNSDCFMYNGEFRDLEERLVANAGGSSRRVGGRFSVQCS